MLDAGGIWFFMFAFMGGSFASFSATGHPISDRPGVNWSYSANRRPRTNLSTQFRIPAARCTRAVQNRFAHREEGAGNAGCLLHPRSRVQSAQRKTHTSIQVQSEHSGIPPTIALRLLPPSPLPPIRLATVIGGLTARLRRLG